MRKFLGNGLLLLGSVLFGLAATEIIIRALDEAPLFAFPLPLPIGADTTQANLDKMPLAPGIEREWFSATPAPLPNRKPVTEQAERWYRELERTHAKTGAAFNGGDLLKAWNSVRVGDPCKSSFFRTPPAIYEYDPPDGKPRPPYRFLPTDRRRHLDDQRLWLARQAGAFQAQPAHDPHRLCRRLDHGQQSSDTLLLSGVRRRLPRMCRRRTRKLDLHFEVMNAGRESVDSHDIAAIVRQEVVPLRPDLVVYYEGANQFSLNGLVHDLPKATAHPPEDLLPPGPLAAWLSDAAVYSALARRIQAATGLLYRPGGGAEWPKPAYKIDWPKGLDEQAPDISRPDLPTQLSKILRDLDQIRGDLADVGSELAVSSFRWMVRDGLVLDPVRHRYIIDQLNVRNFPFTYKDIARVAAFQNRVFEAFARAHDLPFIDVDRTMPFDPDLYFDAIHKTYPGERMQGWVVFQALVPLIEQRLASHAWPRTVTDMPDVHPAFTVPPRPRSPSRRNEERQERVMTAACTRGAEPSPLCELSIRRIACPTFSRRPKRQRKTRPARSASSIISAPTPSSRTACARSSSIARSASTS